jgi:hypothetical protein
MDAKLVAKLEAALDAAEAMFKEIEEPTMNLGEQYQFCKSQMKHVKAARKALQNGR